MPNLLGFFRIIYLFCPHSRSRELAHEPHSGVQSGFQNPKDLVGGPQSLLEQGTGKGVSHWSTRRRQRISIALNRSFPSFHILDQKPTQLFNLASYGLFLFADGQECTLV